MTNYRELFGFFWQFIKLQKWTFFFIFFLDSFAWPLEALLWPYILHVIIDIFTQFELDRIAAWHALQLPIISVVFLVGYVEAVSRFMGYLMARAVPKLLKNLRMKMFDHVQRHSPNYFNERFSGALANKMTDMTTKVEVLIQQLFWPLVPAISTCILGSIFFWFINPNFAWILLLWVILHLTICIYFTKSVDVLEHKHGEARSNLLGKIVDSLTNNFTVNLFYRFSYENKKIGTYQKTEEETNIISKRYVEKMRTIMSIFYFVVVILGMYGFVIYLWLHNQITTGQTVQILTSMWSITMLLWSVGSEFPVLFQTLGIAKQAYSIMKEPTDLGDKPEAKNIDLNHGEIRFQEVSFAYTNKPVFRNLNVKINGGEKIGLVGYTGAGKSTFTNLLLRFFPVNGGRVLIDGQDISQLTLESLRNNIALIPQEPVLFHRSLAENIAYGKPGASQEEIIEAAKLAHCHEFIQKLPNQYQAKVGERGTKLSGGEKQRVAIARAILSDAPILLLDEATSSLDSITEKYIQESLDELMENRTSIVIAHRLSTLSHLDRILVFDKGRIVEEGSHKQLLKYNGQYAKMWHMQQHGFLPHKPR